MTSSWMMDYHHILIMDVRHFCASVWDMYSIEQVIDVVRVTDIFIVDVIYYVNPWQFDSMLR